MRGKAHGGFDGTVGFCIRSIFGLTYSLNKSSKVQGQPLKALLFDDAACT